MHPLEKRVLLPHDLQPVNDLQAYKAQGGLKGLERVRSMSREDVIAEVKNSGLRGRGGAGFPAGIKWETVYKDDAPKKYVVCNAAEGEPGTYKDRYLIGKNPYLLLEGLLIIAHVIGAKEAIIGTKRKYIIIKDRLMQGIRELEEAGVVEPGYIRLVLGPDDYLLGEEKALLEVIDGRGAMPRFYPPFLVGVGYSTYETNPTVVNNAETMSHVAMIMRQGADWFKNTGFEDTPGTMIMTLTGDVKNPGMYEIELGITVRQFLYEIGGGPRSDREFKAVFSGVSNRVMTPDQFDLPMGFGTLRKEGVGLGSGGFIVYDESHNMVDLAFMWSSFLAKESCGQCIPCNMGCRVITEHLKKLRDGTGSLSDIDDILEECGRCTNQTRCFLPTQESIVIGSIINKFKAEFEAAAHNGANPDNELILPKLVSFDEGSGEFSYEDSTAIYAFN